MNTQIIEKDGKPQWAVIPYDQYLFVLHRTEQLEDKTEQLEDLLLYQQAKAKKNPEFVPSEIVDRIIDGENLVRVWREYRGLSQQQLADMGNISQTELSKIELGEYTATTEILVKLAKALDLNLDDLMTNHSEF